MQVFGKNSKQSGAEGRRSWCSEEFFFSKNIDFWRPLRFNGAITRSTHFCLLHYFYIFRVYCDVMKMPSLSSYLVLANLGLVNDDVCFLMRITADLSSGGKSKLCERNMTAPPPSQNQQMGYIYTFFQKQCKKSKPPPFRQK